MVTVFRTFGLEADRKPLKGNTDEGDLWVLLPNGKRIMIEVKTGKQTKGYSRTTKREWLRQTKAESENSEEEGFLIINSYGRNVMDSEVWSADGHSFWYLDEFVEFILGRNGNGKHQEAAGSNRSGT